MENKITTNEENFVYPPAEYIKALHEIKPEFAKQFMDDSREKLKHDAKKELLELELKRVALKQEFNTTLFGRIFGFISLITFLGFIVYLLQSGNKDFAFQFSIIITSLIGIIAAFTHFTKK